MTEYGDDVTFQILGPAIRLPGAGRGESTEIARVSAGRRLREEQEQIMGEGQGPSESEDEPGCQRPPLY